VLNGAWLRFSGRAARIHSHFGEIPTNHQLGLLTPRDHPSADDLHYRDQVDRGRMLPLSAGCKLCPLSVDMSGGLDLDNDLLQTTNTES
jgi:hypothetical protein